MDINIDDYKELKNSDKVEVLCHGCGLVFTLIVGEFRRRTGKRQRVNLFCTPECRVSRLFFVMPRADATDSYGRPRLNTYWDDDWQNRYYLGDG